MEDRELLQKSDPEFDRLAFTVLAIEASAQKMGISPSEMRKRLDKARRSNSGSLLSNCSLSSILYKILYLNANLKIFPDIPLKFGVK